MGTLNINIKSILLDLLRRLWIMALAFLVAAAGFYFLIEKRKVVNYTSRADMFISTSSENVQKEDGTYDTDEIPTYYYMITVSNAGQLINMLQIIMPKDVCTAVIMDELDRIDGVDDDVYTGASGIRYSAAQIGAMVTLTQIRESVVMSISVTTTNPDDSITIVNATCDALPNILNHVVGRGQVSPLQMAKSSTPSNLPSFRQPIIFGAGVLLVVALIIILRNIFDTSIHGKEEIVSTYHLTVLGEIPHFSPASSSSKSGKGYYSYARKKE